MAISVNSQGDDVTFESVWHTIKTHGEDIAWAVGLAVVFGIIFAIIVDILGVGSRSREAIRELKNRRAERIGEKTC